MRSDGFFFLQILQREQWSNRSLPNNLRYQDPKFFGFHSDIRRKFFFLQICPAQFVPPWSVGFLSSDPFFFCLFISNGIRRKKKLFRSFGVQICTTPIRRFLNTLYRSDGFLALQIRRFFAISDPTVFGHPRSDGFFTTQFPMDFWLSKSSRLWNPEDLNKIQVGCNAKQWYDPLHIFQQSHEFSKWNSIVCSSKAILWHHGPRFGWMMVLTVSRQDSGHGKPGMKGCKK